MCNYICLTNSAAKFVESDRGDILSPKKAPEMTAPAVKPRGIPILVPILIIAIPEVPRVPQDVPVATEVNEHTINVVSRKYLGVIIVSPLYTTVGIVPALSKLLLVHQQKV